MIRESSTAPALDAAETVGIARHRLSGHYEALFRRLRFAQAATAAPRTLGVTSCAGGEGVSTVAANLAICAARGGFRVLLVDANTANPSVARTFHVAPRPGLVDLLSGEAELDECRHATEIESLGVIPAGPAGDADTADLDWSRLAEVVAYLKPEYDLVVFDLPAADELSPCPFVAALLDGVLLVVESERTAGDTALRTKRQLELAGAKLLGVVLNKGRS
jgi:capsular exopolysaccharide synthesis family protein